MHRRSKRGPLFTSTPDERSSVSDPFAQWERCQTVFESEFAKIISMDDLPLRRWVQWDEEYYTHEYSDQEGEEEEKERKEQKKYRWF